MTPLFADVRHAWRAVRAHAALSCAIGANTSVFSLVNAVISPTYSRTFGVPPIAGRWFQDRDTAASAPVVLISRTLARRYWTEAGAIGAEVAVADADPPRRVRVAGTAGRTSGGVENRMTMLPVADVRGSLSQAPRVIEGLIAAVPRDSLEWREVPGAWTAVEVLAHLADGEITDWYPRVEKILSGGGRFASYDREGGFVRYRGWTADALVGEFGQLRRANLEKLDRLELTAPHLRLTGEHPEFGTVTLEQLLATWAAHDMAHVAQLSRIFARAFGRHVGPWTRYFSLLKDWRPDA